MTQKLSFFFIFLFAFASITFTSCTGDDDMDPSETVVCDSLNVTITMDGDSLSLTADVTGGEGPYTYQWSDGSTTATIVFDGVSDYSVVVTDANDCVGVATIEFSGGGNPDPCENFAANIILSTDSTGTDDELLLVNILGGTGPYTYLWSDGSTASILVISTSGTYTVTVTDANGCTFEASYTVTTADPCELFTVQIVPLADSLSNDQDFLNAYANYGTAPYSYLWSTGETTYEIEAPAPGTYSVTATDANGCTGEDDYDL